MRAAAIIVAGGTGSRMGRPKQFLPLAGSTVLENSLACFAGMPEIEMIVLVMSPEDRTQHAARLVGGKTVVASAGATRMASVRSGFSQLDDSVEIVAVHDGARALITPEIVRATLTQAARDGAAIAAVPVKDTLKVGMNGYVSDTPDRSRYWSAQTPQTYRYEILKEALTRFPDDLAATDESQLVERCGRKVTLVSASYENLKITTPEDMTMAEAILESRRGGRKTVRVGFGFDIHRLVSGRELWLAGVRLPHSKGLLGHSDGDAVLHAACDAVLGAIGLGEIGLAFPPEDPRFKGLASKAIVDHTLEKLASVGADIVHLDATLVAEEPKMKPHYGEMKASLARCFRLRDAQVSLKAKSHEGLDSIGRGEAIACHAVATVQA